MSLSRTFLSVMLAGGVVIALDADAIAAPIINTGNVTFTVPVTASGPVNSNNSGTIDFRGANSQGVSLTIDGDHIFENDNELSVSSILDNNGTLINTGLASLSRVENQGTLTNTGHANLSRVENQGTIDTSGSLNITRPVSNRSGGAINNSGTIRHTGTIFNRGTINNSGTVEHRGVTFNRLQFNNTSSGTLENFYHLRNHGTFDNSGRLINRYELNNEGTFDNSGLLENSRFFENTGLVINSGTLRNTHIIGNHATLENTGAIENEKDFSVDGMLFNRSGAIFRNHLNTGFLAVAETGTFENAGILENSHKIFARGPIDNTGTIINNTRGLMHLVNRGSTVQNGAVINDGLIRVGSTSAVTFTGAVSGAGIVEAGSTTFTGTLNAGNSPGLMTLTGNTNFADGLVLTMEINGEDRGDLTFTDGNGYDAFDISGDLFIDLGASLMVDLLDGFTVSTGDTFDLAYVSGSVTGEFGTVTDDWLVSVVAGSFGEGGLFANALRVEYVGDATPGDSGSIPEPAMLGLFVLGLIGLRVVTRQRRTN